MILQLCSKGTGRNWLA